MSDVSERLRHLHQEAEALEGNQPDEAVEKARQALALAQQANLSDDVAKSLRILASALEHQAQYQASIEHAQQALRLYAEMDNQAEMAACACILGWNYYNLGLYADATHWAVQGLAQAEAADHRLYQADLHNLIGSVYSASEDHTKLSLAVEHYQRSLQLYTEVGFNNKHLILNNLAMVYAYLDDYAQSLIYAHEALERSTAAGDIYGQISSLGSLTIAHRYLEQYDQAISYAQRRLALCQAHPHPMMEAHTLMTLGRIYSKQGQFQASLDLVHEALVKAQALSYLRIVHVCHEILAEVYEKLGQLPQALQHYKAYHETYARLTNEENMAQVNRLQTAYELEKANKSLAQERRRRDEERASYEALHKAQMSLLSSTSHDIKNPLATILLNVDLLERSLPGQDKLLSHLKRLKHAANRIQDLVAQLLDKTLIESGYQLRFESVALADFMAVLRDDVILDAEEREIELVFQHADEQVVMDAHRMRQALRNLLSNAIKYTPVGGRVSLRQYSESKEWVFEVQDNGIGIPEDALPHLFTPFYRVNSSAHREVEGTGLGLAIVKSIIDQHQGEIVVRSSAEGTLFSLRLPQPSN